MAFNGSGTFNLAAGNPVVTNTTISSSVQNATLSDIATGLTNCVTRDGQSPATANLPMGNHKITGLADGTLTNDCATFGQVQSGAVSLIGSISGADTITGALTPALTAYATGQIFRFVSAGANTGAATLNINSLGAKAITKLGTTALAANDIPSSAVVQVVYDGTQFQLVGLASSHATLADLATNATTATNLASGSAGTLPYQSASGTTAMLAAGTSGNVLLSGGAAAPSWSATTGTGSVVKADSPALTGTPTAPTATLTDSSTKIATTAFVASKFASGTAISVTGTAVDFTGIPSGVKRITVIFNQVSFTLDAPHLLIQIGSGSISGTGYIGSTGDVSTSSTNTTSGITTSNGFPVFIGAAASSAFGSMVLTNITGNTWISSHAVGKSTAASSGGGVIVLGGVIDRVRITSVTGTGIFDSGSVNIFWE